MILDLSAAAALDVRLRASVRHYATAAWQGDVASFVRELYPRENVAQLAAEAGIGSLSRLQSLAWEHDSAVVTALAGVLTERLRVSFDDLSESMLPWQLLFGRWLRLPGEIFEYAATVHDELKCSSRAPDSGEEAVVGFGGEVSVKRGSDGKKSLSSRKSHGSFYTPVSIVEATLDRVFRTSSLSLESDLAVNWQLELAPTPVGSTAGLQESAQCLLDFGESPREVTVLDPAMGCGFFLLSALRRLVAARLMADPQIAVVIRDLDHVDEPVHGDGSKTLPLDDWLMPGREVLRRAISDSLRFAELDPRCVAVFQSTLALVQRAFGAPPNELVYAAGVCGDALTSSVPAAQVVVGNPPWQSYSGRHSHHAHPALDALIERHPEVRSWPSSHGLFTLQALRTWMTKDEGAMLGFVLPAALAHLDSYGPLRAALRSRCQIEEPLQVFEESAFAGVIHESLILIARRRAVPSLTQDSSPFQVEPRQNPGAKGGDGKPSKGRRIRDESSVEADQVARMRRCPKPLPQMFGDIGVHTGNCARKLIRDEPVPGSAPILEGKDISAFACGRPRRWLNLSYKAEVDEYFRIARAERFRAATVIIRQTASDIIACGNPSGLCFRNSALGCFPPDDVDVGWVLAWLNHELVTLFHRSTVYESGQKTFPQVKIRHLRNLPCPDWEVLRETTLPDDRDQQFHEIQRQLLRRVDDAC